MSFYGRERELARLNELLKKRTASLVVIKGRRRIGKSRLTEVFGEKLCTYTFEGLPPEEGITANRERENFAWQLHKELKIPLPKHDSWEELLWHLAEHTKNRKALIILDEINWLGSKDPAFLGVLKNCWDQQFSKNSKLIMILCGSLSGWIEKKILSSTGFVGRLTLEITLEELPLKACNLFFGPHPEHISSHEKFKIISVTGGVPRYLEEIHPTLSAEENIKRICLSKEGFLFNEFDRLFSQLFFKKGPRFKEILLRLAESPCTLEELYAHLHTEKTGLITEYAQELISAGFISRHYTWNIKEGTEMKYSQFRLKDNYIRFYLKYILKNVKKILSAVEIALPGYASILGLQFENLVLSNRQQIKELLNIDAGDVVIDNPFFQKPTQRQKGCQIDYAIQTRHNNLYLCEVKFAKDKLGIEVVREMHEKMVRMSLPRGFSVRPVLIHVNGVSEAVEECNFFHHIIDFGQLL